MKQFEEKNAQVLGLSCDPWPALRTWAISMGGIGHPLLSDFYPHGKASQSLGIFNAEGGYPNRSISIIDPAGTLRAQHTYPAGTLPQAPDILAELGTLQGK